MAEPIVQEVEVRLDTSKTKRASSEFEKNMGKMFDRSALKAVAFNQALNLGIKAVAGIVNVMKQGIKQALEYERTTNKLNAALRMAGHVSGEWNTMMQAQSSELQNLTGIGDETIRMMQAMALNSGVGAKDVDKLVRASIRLSNAFEMDTTQAMRNLIKTTAGLTGELGEAVPWIRTMTKEQLEAGGAIDGVNAKLGDQLTVLMQGVSGSQIGIIRAWGDFTEQLGKNVTESATYVGGAETLNLALSDMTVILQGTDGFGGLIAAMAALADYTIPFFGTGGDAAKEYADQLRLAAAKAKERAEILNAPMALVDTSGASTMDFAGESAKGSLGTIGGEKKKKGRTAPGYDYTPEPQSLADKEAEWAKYRGRYQEHQDALAGLDEQIREGKREMAESDLQYKIDLSEKEYEYEQKIAAKKSKMMQKQSREVVQWASFAARTIQGAAQAIADGSVEGILQFVFNTLSGVGTMMQGWGAADMARGIAMNAAAPGSGVALMAAATNEIAVGTALQVGGLFGQAAVGVGSAVASAGGDDESIEGGGGAGDFAAGGGGARAGATGTQEEKTIVINLNGPVYDGPAAGVAIMERIAEAKQQGF